MPPTLSRRVGNQRGAVDWTAITALMATITAIASLFIVVRALSEIRRERRETRFTIAVDSLWRMGDEWDSPTLTESRTNAATSLLAGRASDDIDAVLRFFDRLAFLAARGEFDDDLVWHEFYWPMVSYWSATADYRQHLRADDAPRWKDLEELVDRLVDIEARHRDKSREDVLPSKEQIREFLLAEVSSSECSDDEETEFGPL